MVVVPDGIATGRVAFTAVVIKEGVLTRVLDLDVDATEDATALLGAGVTAATAVRPAAATTVDFLPPAPAPSLSAPTRAPVPIPEVFPATVLLVDAEVKVVPNPADAGLRAAVGPEGREAELEAVAREARVEAGLVPLVRAEEGKVFLERGGRPMSMRKSSSGSTVVPFRIQIIS